MHSEADSPLLLHQCPWMKCSNQIRRNFCAVISNRRPPSLWLLIWIGRAVQGWVTFSNRFFGQTGTPCGLDTNLPCRVLASCRNDRLCVQLEDHVLGDASLTGLVLADVRGGVVITVIQY